MDISVEVARIADDVLSLGGRSSAFSADTPLLGAIPELDSMAVVSLIGALEDRLGLTIDDDDINGDVFATFGALVNFVKDKLAG